MGDKIINKNCLFFFNQKRKKIKIKRIKMKKIIINSYLNNNNI